MPCLVGDLFYLFWYFYYMLLINELGSLAFFGVFSSSLSGSMLPSRIAIIVAIFFCDLAATLRKEDWGATPPDSLRSVSARVGDFLVAAYLKFFWTICILSAVVDLATCCFIVGLLTTLGD